LKLGSYESFNPFRASQSQTHLVPFPFQIEVKIKKGATL
jgi:hypothetical protein